MGGRREKLGERRGGLASGVHGRVLSGRPGWGAAAGRAEPPSRTRGPRPPSPRSEERLTWIAGREEGNSSARVGPVACSPRWLAPRRPQPAGGAAGRQREPVDPFIVACRAGAAGRGRPQPSLRALSHTRARATAQARAASLPPTRESPRLGVFRA